MFARLSSFAIWALVAATAVFWALKLSVHAPSAPTYAVAVGNTTTVRGDLNRLLGSGPVETSASAPTAPEANSRFHLLGVMAPKHTTGSASTGVALITVDGKMPKAYSVGAKLDGDLILQSVGLRTASIGSASGGATTITLELPALTSASTGTLPPASTEGAGQPQPPVQRIPANPPVLSTPAATVTPQTWPQHMPSGRAIAPLNQQQSGAQNQSSPSLPIYDPAQAQNPAQQPAPALVRPEPNAISAQ
jgi:general secretion pathway protein C